MKTLLRALLLLILLPISALAQWTPWGTGFLLMPNAQSGRNYLGVSQFMPGTNITFSAGTNGTVKINSAAGGGGGGTVTSFSAGNLSPFFTSSVANPNTTPALSFALISQPSNQIVASPDGASGNLAVRPMTSNDVPALPESKITGLVTDLSLRLQSITNASVADVSLISSSNAPIATLKALKQGANITLTDSGTAITIAASGGSGTLTGITNAGNSSFSLISSSNAPVPSLKSLSAGTGTTLTDQGSNIVIALSGTSSTQSVDVLSLDKPIGVTRAIQGKQVSVTNGSAYTFVNITNASGYLSDLWMALNTTGDDGSRIAIIADGVTEYSNRYDQFFGQMFFRQTFAPFFFDNAYLQNRGGQGSYIPIPFTNSLRMQYVPNGNDSMWFQASFHTNVADTFPNTRHFHTTVGNGVFFTVNQVATLLSITNNPPGRLLGIYFFIDSFHGGGSPASASPATAPLEGRVHIITDGVEAFTSSGTEDYARMAGYFASVTNGYSASPYVSLSAKNVDHWGFMRFHIPDPITFTNALTVQWDAGYSAFVNYTGSVALNWVVYYYTE